jgi:hypothetical protein
MGCITEPGVSGAIIVHSEGKLLLESRRGGIADVTRFGNEIQDDVAAASMVLADDLNADGTVDIYIATRQKGSPSFFATNRGYASFMLEEKYAPGKVIPAEVYNTAAAALAAGDVDGDGANDLLVAGSDGTIRLLLNRTLEGRLAATRPSTPADERKRIEAKSLTVRFDSAVGVVGARVRLLDAEGACVAAGAIGSNIGVGCCGPQQTILTVREPGRYVLEVQFSDGAKSTTPVDLQADKPRHQVIKAARCLDATGAMLPRRCRLRKHVFTVSSLCLSRSFLCSVFPWPAIRVSEMSLGRSSWACPRRLVAVPQVQRRAAEGLDHSGAYGYFASSASSSASMA